MGALDESVVEFLDVQVAVLVGVTVRPEGSWLVQDTYSSVGVPPGHAIHEGAWLLGIQLAYEEVLKEEIDLGGQATHATDAALVRDN